MSSPTRLTAPRPEAWRPNDLETTLARGLATDQAPFIAPYFLGAQIGRMNAADSYSLALEGSNALAMQEGAAERAAEDVRSRRTLTGQALQHPGAAAAFQQSAAELTSPEVGETLLTNYNRGQVAEAIQREGAGINALGEAGLVSPMGSNYTLSGGPGALSMVQGTPRDLQQAQISAASRAAGSGGGGAGGDRQNRALTLLGVRQAYEDERALRGEQWNREREERALNRPPDPLAIANYSLGVERQLTTAAQALPFRQRASALAAIPGQVEAARQRLAAQTRGGATPAAVPGDATPSPNAAAPIVAPTAVVPPSQRVTMADPRLSPAIQNRLQQIRQSVPGVSSVRLTQEGGRATIQYLNPATGQQVRVPVQ